MPRTGLDPAERRLLGGLGGCAKKVLYWLWVLAMVAYCAWGLSNSLTDCGGCC